MAETESSSRHPISLLTQVFSSQLASFIHDKQEIAAEFSRFVREGVQYLRRNNEMSDSGLRYMENRRRPFGREVDHKLLFVYRKQFAEIGRKRASRHNTPLS